MSYKNLAEQFFQTNYQMKKVNHQQIIDESLRGEIFTLLFLRDRKNNALPGEISEIMQISSARVASILNNLENKGFIERQIDKADRRRILVSLTSLGKESANAHYQEVINQICKMFEILGEKDAKEFIRIMNKILDIASTMECT
ncbi:MAG: winged helix-turn-helix transcriptional regulator [Clostridiaceae bacterium]|nr:winged helix-turn-helix transcriptional regulator [Clostridiaceae bacterium]